MCPKIPGWSLTSKRYVWRRRIFSIESSTNSAVIGGGGNGSANDAEDATDGTGGGGGGSLGGSGGDDMPIPTPPVDPPEDEEITIEMTVECSCAANMIEVYTCCPI